MKNKILTFVKKLNPHIIIPCFILLCIVLIAVFIAKWAKGVDSTYNRDEIDDSYEIEVLDRVFYVSADTLGEHIPNETKRILCLGNSPFSDDRNSKNNLCNLIQEETGAEVINASIPDSYLACRSRENTFDVPTDYHTFYWLSVMAALKNADVYANYNEICRGISEVGDDVVDTLYKLDLNTIDSVVLMYDASDFLDGMPKENEENSSDPKTFCGNMTAGIELLQKNYPHLQIFVMSPTFAYVVDENGDYISSDIAKVDGYSLANYSINQLNICLVLEASFMDNIYGTINSDNADKYLEDNVHLNVSGRKLVAEKFAQLYEKSWGKYEDSLK